MLKLTEEKMLFYRTDVSEGDVRPRTGNEGPEGVWRYSSTLSLTLALDEVKWLTPRPGRYTPAKETRYLLY